MTEHVAADASPAEAPVGLARDAWRGLVRKPAFIATSAIIVLMLVMAIWPGLFAGWFGHGNPRTCDLARSGDGPTSGHPFGFDKQGCDVYANVIHGARASISVGVLVTGIGLAIAVVLGSLAGYFGRLVDAVISRVTDIFFGFPFILGALVVLTSVPDRNVWTVSAVLALFGWPTLTRVMRSSVLAVREREYVKAGRSLGAGPVHLLRRHILPNSFAPVLVVATINLGGVIVAEAALTFLGIGLQSPAISWGLQLSQAQTDFTVSPHLLIFPSIFLSLTVLSFILIGDLVRDAFDPRLKR